MYGMIMYSLFHNCEFSESLKRIARNQKKIYIYNPGNFMPILIRNMI